MKIHLDTDIGGDIDDLCALAMLLKWPGVELTGITTVAEENGRRAGYTRRVLDLAGRGDIPIAAGADAADGYFRYPSFGYPPDEDNWGEVIAPRPGPPGDALALLKRSIEQGATIAAIGPFTNLALLEKKHPGILGNASLVLMGGSIFQAPEGFPRWPNDFDFNIQTDVSAALTVCQQGDPTFVPLAVSAQTALRQADLPRIAGAGPLGGLIVRQAKLFAQTEGFAQNYGAVYPGLPDDIINFQHDPLACAIAAGWQDGVTTETVPLNFDVRDGFLVETPAPGGLPRRVVTGIDADAFAKVWLDVVCG